MGDVAGHGLEAVLLRYSHDGRMVFSGAHDKMIVWRAATRTHELASDDLLVLYTDGVVEAMDADREEFGMERLCAAIEATADCPGGEIRDRVMSDVSDFTDRQRDDVSLLVIRYEGNAGAS